MKLTFFLLLLEKRGQEKRQEHLLYSRFLPWSPPLRLLEKLLFQLFQEIIIDLFDFSIRMKTGKVFSRIFDELRGKPTNHRSNLEDEGGIRNWRDEQCSWGKYYLVP